MPAFRVLTVAGHLILATGASSDEFDYIVQQRLAAHDRIMAGELQEGATDLIASLRALPLDKPRAADAALGSMQLMLFTVEYLMDAATWSHFASQVLDPTQHPIDDYLHFLFQINDDRGITQETMNEVVRKLYEFSYSDHTFVKIGALAIMSDPYYFRDSKLGQDALDRLTTEFPNLAITEEALRQALYVYREDESMLAEELEESNIPHKSLSTREESPARAFQAADPLIARMRSTIDLLQTSETQGETLSAMCRDAHADSDWRMRYGLLHMAEPYGKKGQRFLVKETCQILAQRTDSTPDVTRAQCLLVQMAQEDGDMPAAEQCIDKLLQQRRTMDVLERNLYEAVMQTVEAYAKGQAARGDTAGAVAALEKLAAKYPDSALADRCLAQVAELNATLHTGGG
jgi:hypothetical protein